MCGVTGWVSYERDLTQHAETIDAMTATLARRGPDAAGTWLGRHAGLGHRRLAVIDLPGGRQPMSVRTPGGDVVLVYSGEAYNFTELRSLLRRSGHRFATESDTEVVLRGYLQWGARVVDRLEGMFAFAVWDSRDATLRLFRDRMGIKPLYYYPTRDGVLFGSEPKAILVHPLARKVVGAAGLRELFAYTKPPGLTVWEGMHEVVPGTVVTVAESGITTRTYWSLTAKPHTDDLPTTLGRVRELLEEITRQQLVADVPRCLLLSGGLDSSVLTGFAAQHLRAEGAAPRTFSVDFPGHEERFVPDETRATPDTPFVRDVVRHVGSVHRDLVLDPEEHASPAARASVVTAEDVPTGLADTDGSLYLLFRAIRQTSTVALSGESADEVFGGYRWYATEARRATATFPWVSGQPALMTGLKAPLHRDLAAALDIPGYLADQYATAAAAVDHLPGDNELERRMRVVFHLNLTRHLRILLDRKDRTSMAVGLEVRVPYCDHRLVEYVYNTPWSFKSFDGREKSLLRHAAKHVLPQSVIDRVKVPYPSTQDPGFACALQQQAKELLSEHDSPAFELVDREWLSDAVAHDPGALPVSVRHGIDRALHLAFWMKNYRPELNVG